MLTTKIDSFGYDIRTCINERRFTLSRGFFASGYKLTETSLAGKSRFIRFNVYRSNEVTESISEMRVTFPKTMNVEEKAALLLSSLLIVCQFHNIFSYPMENLIFIFI